MEMVVTERTDKPGTSKLGGFQSALIEESKAAEKDLGVWHSVGGSKKGAC